MATVAGVISMIGLVYIPRGPQYKYLTAFLKIKRPAGKWGLKIT